MGFVLEFYLDENRFDFVYIGVSDVYFSDGLYWMWYFGGDC